MTIVIFSRILAVRGRQVETLFRVSQYCHIYSQGYCPEIQLHVCVTRRACPVERGVIVKGAGVPQGVCMYLCTWVRGVEMTAISDGQEDEPSAMAQPLSGVFWSHLSLLVSSRPEHTHTQTYGNTYSLYHHLHIPTTMVGVCFPVKIPFLALLCRVTKGWKIHRIFCRCSFWRDFAPNHFLFYFS